MSIEVGSVSIHISLKTAALNDLQPLLNRISTSRLVIDLPGVQANNKSIMNKEAVMDSC
jgi:hypothetical protein